MEWRRSGACWHHIDPDVVQIGAVGHTGEHTDLDMKQTRFICAIDDDIKYIFSMVYVI